MRVVILITDDENGIWDIYDESGQMLEYGFESESEAIEFALDQKWERVDMFNTK